MKRARDPERIRAAIDARGLTLREVALLAGCSDGTVRFILDGKNVSPELARRLARVLHGRVDDLFVAVDASDGQRSGQRQAIA